MLNMSPARLEQITERAELWHVYGDTRALQPQDVTDLITEVRELWAQRAHHIATIRQLNQRLGALGTDYDPERHL